MREKGGIGKEIKALGKVIENAIREEILSVKLD